MKFVHESQARRVRFEAAAEGGAAESAPLGARRVMLIASDSDSLVAEQISGRVPVVLRFDYGMWEADIPEAVAAVMRVVPPSNPSPGTTEKLAGLLTAAWQGSEPS